MNESSTLPFCAKCEDKNKPVTPQNGFGVPYRVDEHLFIELYLHEDCADKWYRQFGALRQPVDAACVEPDGNTKSATDAMLQERVKQRAYEIYLARKENPALQDWLLAEIQVRRELQRSDDQVLG
jgi:hypothetical protein